MEVTPKEAQERYDLFLVGAVKVGVVWGLCNDDGWAVAGDEGEHFVPFWINQSTAAESSEKHFPGYVPTWVPLKEFIEDLLPQLQDQGIFVGINTLANTAGISVRASVLTEELSANGT
jgi:hypothetical protein